MSVKLTSRQSAIDCGSNFYNSDKPCKNGHYLKYTKNSNCVQCSRDRSRNLRNNGKLKKRSKEVARRYRVSYSIRKPIKYMLRNAKCRSLKKCLDFSIKEEDITIPEFCPICPWIKLASVCNNKRYNTPTLDRIDNSKGYITSNVRVISWFANNLKNDMSLGDIEELAFNLYAYVYKVLPKRTLPPLERVGSANGRSLGLVFH